jgi:phosphotransferase system HPr (HPr) family protein
VADAKSIMDVLMLTGTKDSALTVSAEGKDEDSALREVIRLFQDKFGESE